MQPGSSIMPGKVNPVIPEVVNQIAFQVVGADVTISFAAESGQLELNVMEPVIAFNLFQSIDMLKRGCRILAEKCVDGITANKERCRETGRKQHRHSYGPETLISVMKIRRLLPKRPLKRTVRSMNWCSKKGC